MAQVFGVQTREALPYHVPNNATFFQAPLTGTKVQKDFDILNLTGNYQDIIVRKNELVLNVLSASDKALASYCFGINCHGAEVFADTVTFLPFQSVALEIDFIEASVPGHSLIRYTVQNKNNLNEVLSIFMDYSGVLGVAQVNDKKNVPFVFSGENARMIYLNFPNQKHYRLQVTDVCGVTVLNENIHHEAALQGFSVATSGLYVWNIVAENGETYVGKIWLK